MKKRFVTFGEILLRVSKTGYRRFTQGNDFIGTFGGSEANVAVSLALLGNEAAYVTRLPQNEVADACLMQLRGYGVDTRYALRGGLRMGLYYFEEAACMRSSLVVYDRADSAFTALRPGSIDWDRVLQGAHHFHWSGIACALTQQAADVTAEAVAAARRLGLTVSCDINYRRNLWQYGRTATDVLRPLVAQSDVIFGDTGEYALLSSRPALRFDERAARPCMPADFYAEWADEVQQLFPHSRHFLLACRNELSANHHTLTGALLSEGRLFTTRVADMESIVDPMGTGDAFVAAYLHDLYAHPADPQHQLDFSLTASTLKNSFSGDFNLATEAEIEAYMPQL